MYKGSVQKIVPLLFEPGGSVQLPQKPATLPYHESVTYVHSPKSNFFKIYLNINIEFRPASSKWIFPLRYST